MTPALPGPSRVVVWVMPDGTRHEAYHAKSARETACWKVCMLGAVYAEKRDLMGNRVAAWARAEDGTAQPCSFEQEVA